MNSVRRYFEAKNWQHISQAICNSIRGSCMDELIQLYQESPRHQFKAPQGARRIVFNHADDMFTLLNTPKESISTIQASTIVPTPGNINSKPAGPQVPAQEVSFTEGTNELLTDAKTKPNAVTEDSSLLILDPEGKESQIEGDSFEETDGPQMDLAVDADALAQSMQDTGGQLVFEAPTEVQIEAALRIQRVYRQVLRNRQSGARKGLSAARNRHFIAYRLQSEKMYWPKGRFYLSAPRYRIIFLGPMPHLLVCLERARTVASEELAQAKRRVASAKHQDLESVQAKVKIAK